MTLLAIDTALDACAAAVVGPHGDLLAETTEVIGRGHAERLMPMLEALLATAGVGYGDLTRVVVTVGPGSFTGIRVGVAAARGLALALRIPAVGVTTLDAHHAHIRAAAAGRPVAIVHDARRGEVYGQLYGADGTALDAPFAAPAREVAARLDPSQGAWVLAGSGAPLVNEGPLTWEVLDTLAFAPIAAVAALGRTAPLGAPPRPLYIRPPDAKPQDKARVAWA